MMRYELKTHERQYSASVELAVSVICTINILLQIMQSTDSRASVY